jgi:hypothetical protein
MASRIEVKSKKTRFHYLPKVGTVIEKRDRNGKLRARCTVLEGGKIRYGGKVYESLSGAAVAACEKLGLTTKTINGWVFWDVPKGLTHKAKTETADAKAA